jgi:hypothetical protein
MSNTRREKNSTIGKDFQEGPPRRHIFAIFYFFYCFFLFVRKTIMYL